MSILIIEHQTTADMADYQPLPPFYERDAIWCVVRRLPDQKTLWRRISLQTTQQSTAAARSRGNSFSGNHQP
jgi:hypothetical protein